MPLGLSLAIIFFTRYDSTGNFQKSKCF